MKALFINGEEYGQAEKIIKIGTDIIGCNDTPETPAFVLRGFNFNVLHEIRDKQGNIVDFDLVDIELTSDKQQIAADGVDFATITARFPSDIIGNAYVMVNGPPVTIEPIIDGQVVIEVSAGPEDVGPISIEVAAGDKKKFIFVEAV